MTYSEVQVCALVIDQIPDPELQLFLSQQIGDDKSTCRKYKAGDRKHYLDATQGRERGHS
jgi:hypothetical protein